MIAQCDTCKKTIDRQDSWMRGKRHFCNKKCHVKFQSTLSGENTNNWKGGGFKFNCKLCGKSCEAKRAKKQPKYCSLECVHKDKATASQGENHWNWKGKYDSRYLRKIAPRPRPKNCEVCGKPGKKRNGITLDHNHKTRRFRGWLCSNCNTALGLVQEDVEVLTALIRYLKANENLI